jgi:hypothetical protein
LLFYKKWFDLYMKKNIVFSIIIIGLAMGLTNCKSNKVSCPAYGGSSTPPGAIPKSTKTRSGVLPSDGKGHRTVLPN